MDMSRRDFVKRCLLAGGTLLVAPGCGLADEPGPAGQLAEDAEVGYVQLEQEGKLAERVEQAYEMIQACRMCPQGCGVNRARGQRGFCRAPERAVIASHQPHFGEEVPLVGRRGSGTIFFSHCSLRCVFCQNWPIAHKGRGREATDEQVADMMLELQRIGCHNINLVTPTHVLHNALSATRIAARKGLRIPLVYNTGGYDRLEMIKLLDGVVDIYLPDIKFMDGEEAKVYTGGAEDYPDVATKAVAEMHRQVGVLKTDGRGIARRGVMIRHLVMPNRVSGVRQFVQWVADNLPKDTYINLMSQYRVEFNAAEHEKIARAISPQEFLEAMDWAEEAELTNLDSRSVAQRDSFRRRWGN